MAEENIVFTVASGLPEVSACGGDLPQFAADLHAYIVRGFSQLDAALAQKERSPHDMCRDISLLAPDSCLIQVSGIDQTQFRYASHPNEIIEPGTGVLPYIEPPDQQLYRAGARIQSTDSDVSYSIRPPIPDSTGLAFGVWLTAGNDANAWISSPNQLRKNVGIDDRFNIHVIPADESQSIWLFTLIIPFWS